MVGIGDWAQSPIPIKNKFIINQINKILIIIPKFIINNNKNN